MSAPHLGPLQRDSLNCANVPPTGYVNHLSKERAPIKAQSAKDPLHLIVNPMGLVRRRRRRLDGGTVDADQPRQEGEWRRDGGLGVVPRPSLRPEQRHTVGQRFDCRYLYLKVERRVAVLLNFYEGRRWAGGPEDALTHTLERGKIAQVAEVNVLLDYAI